MKKNEKSKADAKKPKEDKNLNEVLSGATVDNSGEMGAIRIHNNVIAIIARMATLKVPGVIEMTGSIVDGLAGMIGKKKSSDKGGVHIDAEEEAIVIDITVNLEYGVRIPHVAWQIQNDVREEVEKMTGKMVKSVNVIVQGVQLPGGEKEDGSSEEVES